MSDSDALIALPEVKRLTSLSKPTIYKFVRLGRFPRQVRVSDNRVAWRRGDVLAWIQGRPIVEGREAA